MEVGSKKGLPENAYRELKEGEAYRPIVPHEAVVPEITVRSVFVGLIMGVIFSAGAAFLGLKVAMVFEAAIPIAILAVGLSALMPRKSTILENVIIQSIGAASGVVVAGAIFTIPALFILGLKVDFFRIFLVALFGGVLGILFLIPFRRYFVGDMHGKFPFPEATATTEVLVAGEEGGEQARVLVAAMLVGGIYDFLVHTFGVWKEVFTTRFIAAGTALADKAKLVFKIDVLAAVVGLGYIVGLRYGAIICAGSFLSWLVLVPLVYHFGKGLAIPVSPVTDGTLIASMSAEDIFGNYVRHIGIGGIACAGIVGILKSSKIIYGAFAVGFKEMFSSKAAAGAGQAVVRTNKDIRMSRIIVLILVAVIALFAFFRIAVVSEMSNATMLTVLALLVVLVISFLFTSVAARAIAIVGTNPVSGMTLMTLIVSSLVLIKAGLSGTYGMIAAMLIGGVVCTALSMAGGFITDLKIGYWIGSTPFNQERFKFLGTLVAAAAVSIVILLLNNVYGFLPDAMHPAERVLPAPQANAMAAVIKTFMSNEPVPWILYGVGAIIALFMEMIGIAPLAFALGMYIPLQLNTPILAGGILAHIVSHSSRDKEVNARRNDRGTLIASGFIAGGAVIGVVSAVITYVEQEWLHHKEPFLYTGIADRVFGTLKFGELLALIMFVLLCVYTVWDACRAKKPKEKP
jgi:putative OPT family oligopeptide transporter